MDPQQAILAAFETQIGWCDRLGSPFTTQILQAVSDDIAAGGPSAAMTASWPGDPVADALPLRFSGALHALVLQGAAPDLAGLYPPHPAQAAALRDAVLSALKMHASFVKDFIQSPPQTNEVGRSAALAGGFLYLARSLNLPLRLLEIGASAGLNSVWDRYRYRLGTLDWGEPDSPVHLAPAWHGPSPEHAAVTVAARGACDVAPIDVNDPAQCLRLRAYVWADQRDRLARLDAAIRVVRKSGLRVDRADAAAWLERHLAEPAPECMTVLFHSIMWQYMPADTQTNIRGLITDAAKHASSRAAFAWLRLEMPAPETLPEIRVTIWPDGTELLLGTAHPHGTIVNWRS